MNKSSSLISDSIEEGQISFLGLSSPIMNSFFGNSDNFTTPLGKLRDHLSAGKDHGKLKEDVLDSSHRKNFKRERERIFNQNFLQNEQDNCNWTNACREASPNSTFDLIDEYGLICDCATHLYALETGVIGDFFFCDDLVGCSCLNKTDKCIHTCGPYEYLDQDQCHTCNFTLNEHRHNQYRYCTRSGGYYRCVESVVNGFTVNFPICSCNIGYELRKERAYEECFTLCEGTPDDESSMCICSAESQSYGGGENSSIPYIGLSPTNNCQLCGDKQYLPKLFKPANITGCYNCTRCDSKVFADHYEINEDGARINCEYVRDFAADEEEHAWMMGGRCKCSLGHTYNTPARTCDLIGCDNGEASATNPFDAMCECHKGFSGGGRFLRSWGYYPACVRCGEGSFADEPGQSACKSCSTCEGFMQVVDQVCNTTSDLTCRCRDGFVDTAMTSDEELNCEFVECFPPLKRVDEGDPNYPNFCECGIGYSGHPEWVEGNWTNPCTSVECGVLHSYKFSDEECRCNNYYIGSVTFDDQRQIFTGQCDLADCVPHASHVGDSCKCDVEYTGTLDFVDHRWTGECKLNSHCSGIRYAVYDSTLRSCRCVEGSRGELVWHSQADGHYTGNCEIVECPENSHHPSRGGKCVCDVIAQGETFWDHHNQVYDKTLSCVLRSCTDSPTFYWDLENIDRCSIIKSCGEDTICILKVCFLVLASLLSFGFDIVLGIMFFYSRNGKPQQIVFTCAITFLQLLFHNIVTTLLSFRSQGAEYGSLVMVCLWIVFQVVVMLFCVFFIGKKIKDKRALNRYVVRHETQASKDD